MALVKCSECGKEISSKATACPYCGCPIEDTVKEGVVRIKMPNNIVKGVYALFFFKRCCRERWRWKYFVGGTTGRKC